MNLLSKGMKRLVFDLRDNTGGYFDQALSLGNMFLGKGDEIVYLQGRKRKRQDYKADGKGILAGIPVSVLINESTASSSEIFAGAIQDNDRGVIVGRRSFGKGPESGSLSRASTLLPAVASRSPTAMTMTTI